MDADVLPRVAEIPSFLMRDSSVSPELSSTSLSPCQTVSFPPVGKNKWGENVIIIAKHDYFSVLL